MEDGRIGGEEVGGETKKLSEVVKECVSRWFQETLKEAEDGDIKMQALLSQMYFNGYGTSKDPLMIFLALMELKQASKYIPSVKNTQATVPVTRIRYELE